MIGVVIGGRLHEYFSKAAKRAAGRHRVHADVKYKGSNRGRLQQTGYTAPVYKLLPVA